MIHICNWNETYLSPTKNVTNVRSATTTSTGATTRGFLLTEPQSGLSWMTLSSTLRTAWWRLPLHHPRCKIIQNTQYPKYRVQATYQTTQQTNLSRLVLPLSCGLNRTGGTRPSNLSLSKGRLRFPNRMNFLKSLKQPLTPSPYFWKKKTRYSDWKTCTYKENNGFWNTTLICVLVYISTVLTKNVIFQFSLYHNLDSRLHVKDVEIQIPF